ncbi:hypothetical protein D0C36_22335 [Mucilaginibacter conchicola]|uniref:Uncharacterized protein n=1 Tax=Mucilaginibacter conchicola TaxID=2303333 RepID=A0A372NNL0_9SPHI|nr:hypothetical protein [Mucilaginibacter conchicola]RFZ90521.1 hypothetical protein D0C36_22335 [Mucilaginibacter conchicola]
MYWYNTIKETFVTTSVLLLLSGSYACNKPEIKETGAELKYFDLKGYFKQQADQLKQANPEVNKSVAHNGTTEAKKVHITAWSQELNLFAESDINKPAWRSSYAVKSNADSIIYTALSPELKTRQVIIRKNGANVTEIAIFNSAHNFLYNTTERLVYMPGKYYSIDKNQKVKVMGANDYRIKGNF